MTLITAQPIALEPWQLNDRAKELRDLALNQSALIARVTNADQNAVAVNAQRELKRVLALFEKSRKAAKEPLLERGRELDRLVATESAELEKEFGRISQVVAEFQVAEQARVREEERLQREELARIERERLAELKRIADEQAAREAEARRIQEEADRKVREAQEAAERLAREATNKKQREAAEAARQEALRKQALAEVERQKAEAIAREQAAAAAKQAAAIEERSAAATYAESRPVQSTRESGQIVKMEWEITVLNPYELAKYHPDCVKIEPLLTPIKAALNEGRTVKGVKAEKKTVSSVRIGKQPLAIDV